MSMMDETPDYFIRNNKIYVHHEGSTYVSCGFREHEPSYNSELTDATPRSINNFLKIHSYLYNYDTGSYQKHINSDYKDAFDNDIFIGDKVLFMDCYGDGRFCGYMEGEITGFTQEFVRIIPKKFDRYNSCSDLGRAEWVRKPYRVVVLNN